MLSLSKTECIINKRDGRGKKELGSWLGRDKVIFETTPQKCLAPADDDDLIVMFFLFLGCDAT